MASNIDPPRWPAIGPYICQKLIGSGGYGAVYSAVDPKGRLVAVKLLRPPQQESVAAVVRGRFLVESHLISGFRHPNVVSYLDAGEEAGILWIAQELVTGGDAHQLTTRYPKGVPWTMIAALGRDCAKGLHALHEAGIMHRDVKPSNLFLTGDGMGKIGDLGLARHLEDATHVTVDGNVVGTPDYMAPEQARGDREVDHRADIYGLAGSLYFMAVGRHPHQGGNLWTVLTQLISEPFPNPQASRPDLPADLVAVIRTGGDKDVERRYQTALAFAEDLDRVLIGRRPALTGGKQSQRRNLEPPQDAPRALLVDDDPLVRRIHTSRLLMDGWRVDAAATGAEAMELAGRLVPSAVILDLGLPDTDGLALLRILRSRPGFAAIPILVFTNTLQQELLDEALEAGASAVLGKAGATPRQVSDRLSSLMALGLPRVSSSSTEIPGFDLALVARTALSRIDRLLPDLAEAADATDRARVLTELIGTTRGLAGAAGAVGAVGPAALAEAAELLARQLLDKPERVNASAQRTIGQAVARLRTLEFHAHRPWQPGTALVVDDESGALRLATQALAKVRIPVVAVSDPREALALLDEQQFCLVVTDVQMDGLSGPQLAAQVRSHPQHHGVPVIFVTANQDFAHLVASDPRSGNDAIAKPYLLVELAVKALSHLVGLQVGACVPAQPRA